MSCKVCGREECRVAYFHLCPACEGQGCAACKGNIIPGVVPGEVDGRLGKIIVCTEFGDPAVDAIQADEMKYLTACLIQCRDEIIAEKEAMDEAR